MSIGISLLHRAFSYLALKRSGIVGIACGGCSCLLLFEPLLLLLFVVASYSVLDVVVLVVVSS